MFFRNVGLRFLCTLLKYLEKASEESSLPVREVGKARFAVNGRNHKMVETH